MTDQMLDYTDKVVLVTGGATGIGRATALLFAAHGAAVVIGDIDEQAKETISLIEHAGGQARFVQADVTRAADMERLVGATIETFGGLHAAFNNAGVLPPTAPLADMSEADWDRIIDVDLAHAGEHRWCITVGQRIRAIGGHAVVTTQTGTKMSFRSLFRSLGRKSPVTTGAFPIMRRFRKPVWAVGTTAVRRRRRAGVIFTVVAAS